MDINRVDYRALERGRTPEEAWREARLLREKRPFDLDLAEYEHEAYMRHLARNPWIDPVAPFLPVGYNLAKKFFQQNRLLEMLGKSRRGGDFWWSS